MKLVTFEDFIKLANFFYITIGIQPYHKEGITKLKTALISLIFCLGFINLNFFFIGEIIFVIMAFVRQEHFLDAIMTMSYIGFVLMGNFKMIFILKHKTALTKLVQGLQQIFPKSLTLQKDYNIRYYLNLSSRITMGFSILYMILIWTYNLFNILQYFIYKFCLDGRQIEQALPYFIYSPWDWHNHWSYYFLYALQNIAGYTSAVGQIASDLLLTAFAIQMIMHYDFLSQKLASYSAKGKAKADMLQDFAFLANIVRYHTNLLDLSAQLNQIFGIPLLLNFAASSFVMCFVGFQITNGASPETIVKLTLFLFSSIAQVYLICHYGQQLIDASTQVAQAAYNQNWFMADVRYMKMLILIAERAQKPAIIKATSFVLVSRATLTEIMQMSYKFFALLRTMYSQ